MFIRIAVFHCYTDLITKPACTVRRTSTAQRVTSSVWIMTTLPDTTPVTQNPVKKSVLMVRIRHSYNIHCALSENLS